MSTARIRAQTGQRQGKGSFRGADERSRHRATVTIPLSCRRKRSFFRSHARAFSVRTGKVRTRRVRGARSFLSPRAKLPFSPSLPRSTFPPDDAAATRGSPVISRAERSTASSVKEESMHTVWPRRSREAWRCYEEDETAEAQHRREV